MVSSQACLIGVGLVAGCVVVWGSAGSGIDPVLRVCRRGTASGRWKDMICIPLGRQGCHNIGGKWILLVLISVLLICSRRAVHCMKRWLREARLAIVYVIDRFG